jgi:hypothetical protein
LAESNLLEMIVDKLSPSVSEVSIQIYVFWASFYMLLYDMMHLPFDVCHRGMFNELTAGHTLIWFFQLYNYKLYVHDNDYKWCHELVPEIHFSFH